MRRDTRLSDLRYLTSLFMAPGHGRSTSWLPFGTVGDVFDSSLSDSLHKRVEGQRDDLVIPELVSGVEESPPDRCTEGEIRDH